jgi:hypothetical protein
MLYDHLDKPVVRANSIFSLLGIMQNRPRTVILERPSSHGEYRYWVEELKKAVANIFVPELKLNVLNACYVSVHINVVIVIAIIPSLLVPYPSYGGYFSEQVAENAEECERGIGTGELSELWKLGSCFLH